VAAECRGELFLLVLGIHFGHGAAAALIGDGRVLAAVEEEKVNRVKGYVGFPFLAVEYVLAVQGKSMADVDRVAVGAENFAEFSYCFIHQSRQVFRRSGLWTLGARGLDLFKFLNHNWDSSALLERRCYNLLEAALELPREKIIKVNHHLAHAASAYYCSPWQDALVITADGKGDGLCGGAYIGGKDGLCQVDGVPDQFSVGQIYQAVTRYLGYRVNRHEGKITGLAAFGSAQATYAKMNAVLGTGEDGMYNRLYEDEKMARFPVEFYERGVVRKDYIKQRNVRYLNGQLRQFAIVHQLYQNFLAEQMAEFVPEDLAAGVQRLAEELMVDYIGRFIDRSPEGTICLAGGVFANVKINQRIREMPGVERMFVQPAMDDAGCALGAAMHVAAAGNGAMEKPTFSSVYLGPGYSEAEIEGRLKHAELNYRRSAEPEMEIAQKVHEGKVVGRFSGRLEWGPRALGNRSIIARPTEKKINDELNGRLQRTEFMPFAPSIMAEYASDYLVGYREDDIAARYMTVTYPINQDKREGIAAAVHVDGTARPQVVYEEDQADFHRIISEYHKLSRIPAVLNTSFNMHEEPIVESPDDAIRAFRAGAVDVLSLGPFIVDLPG
jgi:carbamoyltransferase